MARSGLYISLILAAVLSAGAYTQRKHDIFSCSASGYALGGYLSYCNANEYGDYDHGAIWFGLEPAATTAAANAQVLFLGNSRTQFAFSTKVTADWFSSLSVSYYLLGFSHNENYTFEVPLLRRLHPKAKVYVINIDAFFDQSESDPGKTVMQDESAKTRYEEKRQWQGVHKVICTTLAAACGNEGAFFRSPSTGAWMVTGGPFPRGPVSYDENIDRNVQASYTTLGNEFLPGLSADRACTILTVVPTSRTSVGTARAVAAGLGLRLVSPRLDGLVLFDKVHLDRESAERWSAAFFEEAGPQIRKCLREVAPSRIAMSSAKAVNRY